MSTNASQHSFVRRWVTVATAASLVVAGLLGAAPAVADDLAPEPAPVVETTAAPDTEPAAELAPDPEPAPEPAPLEMPSETAPLVDEQLPLDESTERAQSIQSFSTLAATPTVTVTPSNDLDVTVANTVTIEGTGFEGDGAAMGLYVLLGPAGNWAEGTPLAFAGWLDMKHVPASAIVGGDFSTTFTIAANTLTAGSSYMIATSAAHALSATNRSMDTRTPFTTAATVVTPPPQGRARHRTERPERPLRINRPARLSG